LKKKGLITNIVTNNPNKKILTLLLDLSKIGEKKDVIDGKEF
jgi:hypothetical protein